MPRLIAFLRAINVGGHNVTMEELRRHFTALGLKNVETFIASGNVIFEARATDLVALEAKIEKTLAGALGYEVKTFLRTPGELATIVRQQPFDAARVRTSLALNVGFVSQPLHAQTTKALLAMKTAMDDFAVRGREVYWLCQAKQSDSKFSNSRFEKILGARATWRGMNTIARLAAKYPVAS